MVGAAKAVRSVEQLSPTRYAIEYEFVVENLGSFDAPNVQLTDDLAAAFPGVTAVTVTAGPTVSGGLTAANDTFDGVTDLHLLAGNESLEADATATVSVAIEVELGSATGPFSNQAIVTTALTPNGPPVTRDPSDNGSDPDPNGNSDPDEPGRERPDAV